MIMTSKDSETSTWSQSYTGPILSEMNIKIHGYGFYITRAPDLFDYEKYLAWTEFIRCAKPGNSIALSTAGGLILPTAASTFTNI
jgi:hypothetical protein